MKKLVFAIAAVVAVSFASCNGNTNNTTVADSDSVAVQDTIDTTTVDSAAIDSTAADTNAVAE